MLSFSRCLFFFRKVGAVKSNRCTMVFGDILAFAERSVMSLPSVLEMSIFLSPPVTISGLRLVRSFSLMIVLSVTDNWDRVAIIGIFLLMGNGWHNKN